VPQAYIFDAVRTAFGRFGGGLALVRPDDLAAHVVRTLVQRAPELDPGRIDEVVFGNANGAGEENRCVARMATLLAGLPTSIPGTTVNRLCGSSLDAAIIASRQISTGEAHVVMVGGVESMTRAPWVLPKTDRPFPATDLALANTALGWRLVNPSMPSEWTVSLGEATEQLGQRLGIGRERQDAFAARSHAHAAEAWRLGHYDDLVTQVPGTTLFRDESIRDDATIEKLATLKTAFRPAPHGGTLTAGNSSPLNDGASALWLGSDQAESILGLPPIARIASRAAAANDPRDFGFAPVAAVNTALNRAGLSWSDIDAVELNEAFAAQSLACLDAWDVDPSLVNAWGGAIAIGHPLGASGARILGTLAARLRHSGGRFGVAAICIGVGQGLAVVLENVTSSANGTTG
jgi:acetyl-CoA acyltransferase